MPEAKFETVVAKPSDLQKEMVQELSKRAAEIHSGTVDASVDNNLKKLPKVKELDTEYSKLLTEKKALYPDYRKAKEEMQELLRAKRNVELFFAEEKSSTEKTKSR